MARVHRIETGLSCAAVATLVAGRLCWGKWSSGFLASAPFFIARFAISGAQINRESPRLLARYLTRPLLHPIIYTGSFFLSGHARHQLEVEPGIHLRGQTRKATSSKGAILLFSALGADVLHLAELGNLACEMGWDVKLLDIRGYGKSDGFPSPEAHQRDVEALVHSVSEYGQVAVYGHCAGGPLAARAAALAGDKLHCLILDRFLLKLPPVVSWLYPGYDTEAACVGLDSAKIHIFHGDEDPWCDGTNNLLGVEPVVAKNCRHFTKWWKKDCPATTRLKEILGA